MENENFAASKPNEPFLSQNNQDQQQQAKVPVVAIVEEDETKKQFLPQDGVHYKKDFGQVEIKQAPKFIGLTQEELQRYADDPFWRKLRLALFILFWISWILMFVVAIILVVTSPKCPAKPERQWWQKQLCYQTYTRTFQDSNDDGIGDFKGMKEKISDLSRAHVQTIWPVPVLASTNFTGYDVTNFTAVDSHLGTLEDFEQLIAAAHEQQMYVVIDLPMTMSTESDWFNQSSTRSSGEYADYFFWKPALAGAQTSNWRFSAKRNEYYRVYGGSTGASSAWPVLNWNTEAVQEEFKKTIAFWTNKGIDGFYVGHVQLLGLDEDGHLKWDLINSRLRVLRDAVDKNNTGKEVTLFTSISKEITGDHDEIKVQLLGEHGLHYIIDTDLTKVDESCDAKCIHDHLVTRQQFHVDNNDSWPVWEIGNPYVHRVASRLGNNREKAELFQMLLFMLEGSINTYYGDELGLFDANETDISLDNPKRFVMRSPMQWDDGKHAGFSGKDDVAIPPNPDYTTNNVKEALKRSHSAAKLFRKMAEWRSNDEAFLYGEMEVSPAHESVIGIKRNAYLNSLNYYAVMNFANETLHDFNLETELDLTIPASAGDPTVGVMTSNLAATQRYRNRDPIDITKVTLEPYSGLVIKYK